MMPSEERETEYTTPAFYSMLLQVIMPHTVEEMGDFGFILLFMEILKYCTDCDEIQFKEDGSWAPMRSKKEVQEVTASYNGVDGESLSTNPVVATVMRMVFTLLNILSNTSYINTSLIQDYRHPFHMTPMPYDLQGLDFFPFLSGDNQHYNTSLLAAAAAAVSDDQDLLHSSRFFPYTSSQMFLDQLSAGGSTSLPATNGSSSGSNSSLVSSNSLRENHGHGVASRSSADTASIFGIIPDIISLD
ncbi:hypothetical protein A6R68_18064 [Neotoma lepida]|uniref:Uncharacterized protein n=1 Tax=Neotoma lepida TaxID=56216 RepID=A0A1A6HP91_NEOLE|nr:hypothetical protein A6R68_18064 [Neotoma lepida]